MVIHLVAMGRTDHSLNQEALLWIFETVNLSIINRSLLHMYTVEPTKNTEWALMKSLLIFTIFYDQPFTFEMFCPPWLQL